MSNPTPPGVPPGPPPTWIHLVDVDGTICPGGSDQLYPGVVERVSEIRARPGHQVWLFTCRPPGAPGWQRALVSQGLSWDGFLHKPLADHYTVWDDKLAPGGAGTCLCHPADPGAHGAWFSNVEVANVLGEPALTRLRQA